MTDPTTSADYRALLRGVLEDPADDLPRLVLADWLDERGGKAGEIHARFIRRQIGGGSPWANVPLTVLAQLPPLPGREPHQYSFNGSRAGIAEVVYDTAGGVRLIYSRGFVSAVTLTQAAFMGTDCDLCHGSGRLVIHHRTHGDCLTCEGTGRTPGLAASIFGTQPITAVALSSCLPFYAGLRYRWHPEGRHVSPGQEACGIARPLFSRLAGNLHSTGERSYAAAADAHADLSRACVGYGHSLAGLSPLPAGVAVPA